MVQQTKPKQEPSVLGDITDVLTFGGYSRNIEDRRKEEAKLRESAARSRESEARADKTQQEIDLVADKQDQMLNAQYALNTRLKLNSGYRDYMATGSWEFLNKTLTDNPDYIDWLADKGYQAGSFRSVNFDDPAERDYVINVLGMPEHVLDTEAGRKAANRLVYRYTDAEGKEQYGEWNKLFAMVGGTPREILEMQQQNLQDFENTIGAADDNELPTDLSGIKALQEARGRLDRLIGELPPDDARIPGLSYERQLYQEKIQEIEGKFPGSDKTPDQLRKEKADADAAETDARTALSDEESAWYNKLIKRENARIRLATGDDEIASKRIKNNRDAAEALKFKAETLDIVLPADSELVAELHQLEISRIREGGLTPAQEQREAEVLKQLEQNGEIKAGAADALLAELRKPITESRTKTGTETGSGSGSETPPAGDNPPAGDVPPADTPPGDVPPAGDNPPAGDVPPADDTPPEQEVRPGYSRDAEGNEQQFTMKEAEARGKPTLSKGSKIPQVNTEATNEYIESQNFRPETEQAVKDLFQSSRDFRKILIKGNPNKNDLNSELAFQTRKSQGALDIILNDPTIPGEVKNELIAKAFQEINIDTEERQQRAGASFEDVGSTEAKKHMALLAASMGNVRIAYGGSGEPGAMLMNVEHLMNNFGPIDTAKRWVSDKTNYRFASGLIGDRSGAYTIANLMIARSAFSRFFAGAALTEPEIRRIINFDLNEYNGDPARLANDVLAMASMARNYIEQNTLTLKNPTDIAAYSVLVNNIRDVEALALTSQLTAHYVAKDMEVPYGDTLDEYGSNKEARENEMNAVLATMRSRYGDYVADKAEKQFRAVQAEYDKRRQTATAEEFVEMQESYRAKSSSVNPLTLTDEAWDAEQQRLRKQFDLENRDNKNYVFNQ